MSKLIMKTTNDTREWQSAIYQAHQTLIRSGELAPMSSGTEQCIWKMSSTQAIKSSQALYEIERKFGVTILVD